jgi:hypothetical protein
MVSGFRSENEPYMAVFRIYVFYIRVPHKKKKKNMFTVHKGSKVSPCFFKKSRLFAGRDPTTYGHKKKSKHQFVLFVAIIYQ